MIAILSGLGAGVAWAISTLCSSRSSRLIAPVTVVAWVMLTGVVITAPVAADPPLRSQDGNQTQWHRNPCGVQVLIPQCA